MIFVIVVVYSETQQLALNVELTKLILMDPVNVSINWIAQVYAYLLANHVFKIVSCIDVSTKNYNI